MNRTKKIDYSDGVGVVASALCTIHCVLTPFLFMAKPALTETVHQHTHAHTHGPGLWAALDYVFLVISFLAVWYSAEHTKHLTLKWLLWAAWGVFAIGLLLEPQGYAFGKWLMYAGSISLIGAHLTNHYFCQHNHAEHS
ncbi:MAG: MerC domain-containing protein [Bacteroidota bacterium]